MIQIIGCWCIKTKGIQSEIPFDQQEVQFFPFQKKKIGF